MWWPRTRGNRKVTYRPGGAPIRARIRALIRALILTLEKSPNQARYHARYQATSLLLCRQHIPLLPLVAVAGLLGGRLFTHFSGYFGLELGLYLVTDLAALTILTTYLIIYLYR